MRQCRVGLRIKVHNMLVRTTNKNAAMHFQCFSPQPMISTYQLLKQNGWMLLRIY